MKICFGVGEEEAAPELQIFRDPDPFSGARFPDDIQGPVHSTPVPAAPPAPSPASPSLTEEQRRRMELNRQQALERRLARQQHQQTGERQLEEGWSWSLSQLTLSKRWGALWTDHQSITKHENHLNA